MKNLAFADVAHVAVRAALSDRRHTKQSARVFISQEIEIAVSEEINISP
jgi:hypothetical protein